MSKNAREMARRDLTIAARGITKGMTDTQAKAVLAKAYRVPQECAGVYWSGVYQRGWEAELELLMADRAKLKQWEKGT